MTRETYDKIQYIAIGIFAACIMFILMMFFVEDPASSREPCLMNFDEFTVGFFDMTHHALRKHTNSEELSHVEDVLLSIAYEEGHIHTLSTGKEIVVPTNCYVEETDVLDGGTFNYILWSRY